MSGRDDACVGEGQMIGNIADNPELGGERLRLRSYRIQSDMLSRSRH